MSKVYSNRALPSGTILREWRLEEVLGVGGFGIVYKGRGIYFDELVAIKEYFPGSISERDADETVVPIDSDAEEVHALGLKKFVEEAKLLWNLSTPTRHPNIVNVRSLFEIHGTAYMVMDFEDGTSLSRILKDETRFNERTLLGIVRPIAEGLDRAHRVGVLHRDIKPPNILINPDGRPVLIDFGSARFEAAEATSTKVTFHTPPYAAIEQYVRTYDQGPWTDIYALGVVLYECIVGEKPPEVLERLHGGLGAPLAGQHWPGYSKPFLAAVDAAMAIRPSDRPQSIADWLAMFDAKSAAKAKSTRVDIDEDATRVVSYDQAREDILPVGPLPATVEPHERIETPVPSDPALAEFKRAGEDSIASKRPAPEPAPAAKKARSTKAAAAAVAAALETGKPAGPPAAQRPAEAAVSPAAKSGGGPESARTERKLSPILVGAVGLAVASAGIATWAIIGRQGEKPATGAATPATANASSAVDAASLADVQNLPQAAMALANDARTAGVAADPVDRLQTASAQLTQMLQKSGSRPDVAGMKKLAMVANAGFAAALLETAEAKAKSMDAQIGWAGPDHLAANVPADRRAAAATFHQTLAGLRTAVEAASAAADPSASFTAARQALEQSKSFATAASAVSSLEAARVQQAADAKQRKLEAASVTPLAPRPVAGAVTQPRYATPGYNPYASSTPTTSTTGVSAAKMSEFNGIVDTARGMARQVIAMGDRGATGANGQILQTNKRAATNYDKYLRTLKDSMRGVKSDREADRLIQQAKQTKAYVVFLVNQSSQASH